MSFPWTRRLLAAAPARFVFRPSIASRVHYVHPHIPTKSQPQLQKAFSTSPFQRASRYAVYGQPPRQKQSWFIRWVQSPAFYYQIGGAGAVAGVVYIANLEEVPISGRRRFNIASEEMVMASAQEAYAQTLNQYRNQILPEHHPAHRMAERVLQRLIPHVDGPEPSGSWKLHVIAGEERNAFVLPGGKVFVFSGILPICGGEDGLAAVLGHEIAHNVAGHVGEKISQSSMFTVLAYAVSIGAFFLGLPDLRFVTNAVIDLGLSRPNSRTQESEADYIGLMIMSEACYDPRAAVGVWERMERVEQASGGSTPQFLSTHPASHNRMTAIQDWLPKAEAKREEGGCAPLRDYGQTFNQAFRKLT